MSSRETVCRQSISDSWLGNLRECLAHLVENSGCDCLLMQVAPPLQFRNRRSAVSMTLARRRLLPRSREESPAFQGGHREYRGFGVERRQIAPSLRGM